jgi:glutamine synthetase
LIERYVKTQQIEANLMIELFRTQILPAALRDQKMRTESVKNLSELGIMASPHLMEEIRNLAFAIESAIVAVKQIEIVKGQSSDFGWEAKGKVYCEILGPKMEAARETVDHLETLVDNALWPLPKYRELLFIV